VRALRARFKNIIVGGSAPAPWVALDSGHPWPSPCGQTASVQIRSRRICLCLPKDNFAGSKIGRAPRAHRARTRDGAGQKRPKERAPLVGARYRGFPRGKLASGGAHTRHPCRGCARLRSLARPFGPTRRLRSVLGLTKGFLKTPSERAEHRARPGVVARLLIEPEARCVRPAEARRAGDRAMLARRSDRVSFSLVTFSWTSKRKSPRVQGRSHPQLAVECGQSPLDIIIILNI
jgi:hypothetical protein